MRSLCLVLWAVIVAHAAAASDRDLIALGGNTMGSTWRVQLPSNSEASSQASDLQQAIQHELDEMEATLSHWREDSAVSRFNASRSTDWQAVPAVVAEAAQVAQQIAVKSNGALDVTIAPLVDLWGFGARSKNRDHLPDDHEIKAARALCGWRHLDVRVAPKPALRKDLPELRINLSSVAEGLAVDHVCAVLREHGCENFLVELGGEIAAHGEVRRGEPWKIGIQAPDAPSGEWFTSLPLQNQALATSGVYRQHFESGGHSYPHVIDPTSGRPIEHNLASVSVLHARCAMADGYATALLVLGPKRGRELGDRLGLRVVWIARER